ncbi:hypothetical protein ACFL6M_02130 [Candidatus Eisenbacteria bacterium]|uniref:Outer membrane protein beta-barrel domain-containing protein n=1 Tax=Eiseniibacteriota bacterium TaxID=2212470 RepID=A0ABV6YJ58_UNCEI
MQTYPTSISAIVIACLATFILTSPVRADQVRTGFVLGYATSQFSFERTDYSPALCESPTVCPYSFDTEHASHNVLLGISRRFKLGTVTLGMEAGREIGYLSSSHLAAVLDIQSNPERVFGLGARVTAGEWFYLMSSRCVPQCPERTLIVDPRGHDWLTVLMPYAYICLPQPLRSENLELLIQVGISYAVGAQASISATNIDSGTNVALHTFERSMNSISIGIVAVVF